MSALLNGVTFDYDDDPLNVNFHKNATDIFTIHNDVKFAAQTNSTVNIVPFTILNGGKDE